MKKARFSYSTLTVVCAVVIMMFSQIVATSRATNSTASAPALADADLSAESRTLGAFFTDLAKFDKKGVELGRKAALTRAEFDLHERTANDLKRRLSAIQNSLGEVIKKLKAAGQWDNLDEIVLAKINDSEFQNFVRTEGFKKTLEAAAAGRNININEIVLPVEALRKKVAQDSSFKLDGSPLASRAVRVSYTTAPTMVAQSARCRLAFIRRGFSGAFSRTGEPSDKSTLAHSCYCAGNQAACDTLAQAQ